MAAQMTQQKKERFIKAYSELGTITAAAEAAGIERRTHYRWLEDDEYAVAFHAAENAVADKLEQEAIRRAFDGSDTLLIFLLKGHRPEKFRDRVHVKSESEVTIHAKNDLDREIEGLMADLAGRGQGGTPVAPTGPGDATRP